MKINLSEINDDDFFDFCIIGTGPAGITTAMKLAESGKKILLLEGGMDEFTSESQEVYEGTVTGDKYFDLSVARLRFFGGTSNHWNGWCRTLDGHDFNKKGKFATAWPISKTDINEYLDEASSILEIAKLAGDIHFADVGFNKIDFVFSPPVRFLEKYLKAIIKSENLFLALDANATSMETNGQAVTALNVQNFGGQKHTVKAKHFVLATGGIENSRLLLWSNELTNGQIVKNSASLGRYWLEHPDFTIGRAFISEISFGNRKETQSFYMAPTLATMEQNATLSCGLRFHKVDTADVQEIIQDLARAAPSVGEWAADMWEKRLFCGVKLRAAWEQEPTATNRVELGTEKDIFGIPRTNLFWKKSRQDHLTMQRTATKIGEYIAKNNIGRIHLDDWVYGNGEYPTKDVLAGHHHMGGTRMADNPEDGVVDKNCKVHGTENLYVAGSSIFPSGGFCNPTLSIVQLSLRLANHLRNLP